MGFYDAIYETVRKLDDRLETTVSLQERKVIGGTPIDKERLLKFETEKLLIHPEYDDNVVVQRMRDGERLPDIVDEIQSQKRDSLKLPWKRKERRDYNRQADDLDEITYTDESVSWIMNGENYAVLIGSIPGLSVGMNSQSVVIGVISVVTGATLGLVLNYLIDKIPTNNPAKEHAEYIDGILEGG